MTTDTTSAPSPVSNFSTPPATDAEMNQITQADIRSAAEKGWITSETANRHLERLGAAPIDQPQAPPVAESPSDPTTHPAFAPAKAADFSLPNVEELHQVVEDHAGASLTPAETMAINQTTSAWMESAQLPKEIGSGVAKIAGDHIREMPKYDAMNDSGRQAHRLVEESRLQKLWGENYEPNLALAKQLVQEIGAKHPDFIPFLNRTGLGNNFKFIAQMGAHARRLASKKGMLT